MNFDKLFPDEREKGETQLRQCHLVLLRMFKIFDYLCTKYQVEYFLCSGSLRGAITNKGILPWDDDFDVGMTRSNYEKFVKFAVPELPNDIFFQTPNTDPGYPVCHRVEAKLRDKYSSYTYPGNKNDRRHHGIMFDLQVFDRAYLPHNFFIFLLNRTLIFFFKHRGNDKRAKVVKWISKHSPFPLVYSSSNICHRRLIKNGQDYFRKNEISKLKRVKFEDVEASIPQGWNGYLTRKFGKNYMTWPPVEDQKGHHSIELPDPFTPCDHKNILHWKERNHILRSSVE